MTHPRDGGVGLALIQIDDYGPWTTTPPPRRETDLQALQARLFATVADFFGDRDGYAFAGRYDDVLGVANGIDPAAFVRLQERVSNQYPVAVSGGVGTAMTPGAALEAAGASLQAAGSAQETDRREVLDHRVVDDATPGTLTVAHFDVVDATSELTDRVSPGVAERTVRRTMSVLSERLAEDHAAVGRFVGGDDAIAVCPPLDRSGLESVLARIRSEADVEPQVGVGHGPSAHAAGAEGKQALEECRATGSRIEGLWEVADD